MNEEIVRLKRIIAEIDLELYGPRPLNYEPDRALTIRTMKKLMKNSSIDDMFKAR